MKLSSEKENKVIKLFWKDPQKGEEKEAAILILRIFFDFDAEKVRSEILEDDSEDDSDDDSWSIKIDISPSSRYTYNQFP